MKPKRQKHGVADATRELHERLQIALAHGTQLYIETYCRNDICCGREILIRIKDYDKSLVRQLSGGGFDCPICGQTLALHWIQTAQERDASEAREARSLVNHQMHVRDEQKRTGKSLVVVPLSLDGDDRLPPTPSGWFDHVQKVGESTATARRRFVSAKNKEKQ